MTDEEIVQQSPERQGSQPSLQRGVRTSASTGRTVRGGLVYIFMGLAQRGLVLLALPFLLQSLTPGQYGMVAVLAAVFGVTLTLLTFGVETAIFRRLFELAGHPDALADYHTTMRRFLTVVPIGLAVLLAVGGYPIARSLDAVDSAGYALAMTSAGLGVTALLYPQAVLRAQERYRDYAKLSLFAAFAQVTSLVIAIIVLGLGASGWFGATTVASAATIPVGLRLADGPSGNFRWVELRGALSFGLPLLPHAISHWALTAADRLILGAYVSPAQIGVYALGYQVGAVLQLLLTEVNRAVMTEYGHAIRSDDSSSRLRRVVTTQVGLTVVLGLATALLGPPVITAIFPVSYTEATSIVPWVAAGYTLYGFYFVPMDVLSLVHGTTRRVWLATLLAAVLNVALNLLLIPHLGILGAAIATTAGYLALFITVTFYVRLAHGIPFILPTARLLFLISLGLVAAGVGLAATAGLSPATVGIRVTLVFVVAGAATLVTDGRVLISALLARRPRREPRG